MRAGDMRRRVELQQRSITQDAMGAQITTWTTILTCWAQIEPIGGRAMFTGEAVQTEVTHQVVVRYRPLLADPKTAATMRLVYNGRLFNINASIDENERHRQITLYCTEGMSDG